MHVIFVVNCWVNMKPLNRTETTNLQLFSNPSNNQPQFLVWGVRVPINSFAPSRSIFVDQSLASSGGNFRQKEQHKNFLHEIMHLRANFLDDRSNGAVVQRFSAYKYILKRNLLATYNKGASIKTFSVNKHIYFPIFMGIGQTVFEFINKYAQTSIYIYEV